MTQTNDIANETSRKFFKTNTFKKYLITNITYVKRDYFLHAMLILPMLLVVVFSYIPIYGISIAFMRYNLVKGYFASEWVGFYYFKLIFADNYFWTVFKNNIILSFLTTFVGFPLPIILSLLLNEVKHLHFKKIVQTFMYLPHFVSAVIICGIFMQLIQPEGIINNIIVGSGGTRINFLMSPQWFRPLYFILSTWRTVGWGTILYLAVLSQVDMQLYEAAEIDGANRYQKMIYITLPAIQATIIVIFILGFPSLLSSDFESIFLLYRPAIYSTADVISTYLYRRGLLLSDFSYATAMGLILSVMSFILLSIANKICKAAGVMSLW